jgi:hypothetical protein
VTLKEFSNGEEGVNSLIYGNTYISYVFLNSLSVNCTFYEECLLLFRKRPTTLKIMHRPIFKIEISEFYNLMLHWKLKSM